MQASKVVPDTVGFNGFRARFTLLTHPSVPNSKVSDFNGRANWVGVTCNTTYELDTAGPFVHRRIIFKSTVPWPAELIAPADANPAGGIGAGEFVRRGVSDLTDIKTVGCLRRLFAQDTVRGVVQGPVGTLGITVLKDETINLRGSDDGFRTEKKYWNSLKSEPTMQYNISTNGSLDMSLANAPQSQHVYLVDIFSFGLAGLDSSLPDLKTQSSEAPSGQSEDASQQGAGRGAKRFKSDDSVMSDVSTGSFGVSGLKSALVDPMSQFGEEGQANITTVMKLYFRQSPT